jgi:hypothetical protein
MDGEGCSSRVGIKKTVAHRATVFNKVEPNTSALQGSPQLLHA